jgi:hypothetical protein
LCNKVLLQKETAVVKSQARYLGRNMAVALAASAAFLVGCVRLDDVRGVMGTIPAGGGAGVGVGGDGSLGSYSLPSIMLASAMGGGGYIFSFAFGLLFWVDLVNTGNLRALPNPHQNGLGVINAVASIPPWFLNPVSGVVAAFLAAGWVDENLPPS